MKNESNRIEKELGFSHECEFCGHHYDPTMSCDSIKESGFYMCNDCYNEE